MYRSAQTDMYDRIHSITTPRGDRKESNLNLLLGICVGAIVGWLTFRSRRIGNEQQRLRSPLLIGVLGGGIGAQLASMLGATEVTDGNFNLVSLIVSALCAAVVLYGCKYIGGRSSA